MPPSLLNILHLEESDFTSEGRLTTMARNLLGLAHKALPLVIMIKGAHCFHCTRATPEFERIAEHHGHAVVAGVIETQDSTHTAQNTTKKPIGRDLLMKLTGNAFRGVPTYVVLPSAERPWVVYDGDRTASSIVDFCSKAVTVP